MNYSNAEKHQAHNTRQAGPQHHPCNRHIVASIGLTRYVEGSALVVEICLQKFHEKSNDVQGGFPVTVNILVTPSLRVREPHTTGRFQVEHIGHFVLGIVVPPQCIVCIWSERTVLRHESHTQRGASWPSVQPQYKRVLARRQL